MTVFIAVPYTRPHLGPFVASLVTSEMPPDGRYRHVANLPIDLGRNYLAEIFLHDKSCTHLLFIDNDCTFTPDAIRRLMERKVPIVSACMYSKTIPPHPTMGMYLGKAKSGKHFYKFGGVSRDIIRFAREYDTPTDNAWSYPWHDDDLREVDGVGMHFTLIHRDVFEAMNMPYFMQLQDKGGGGEDFYFCRKARELGFPIYYDIGLHTGHLAGEEVDFGIKELLTVASFVSDDDLDQMIADDPTSMWEAH